MRTMLDALIAAGDLGLGTHAQDWGHSQFLEDLEYCSVASSQCVLPMLPGPCRARLWGGFFCWSRRKR